MATYAEIRDLFNDSSLLNRIEVATIVSANGLADNASNNAWVAIAYSSPKIEAKKVLMAVLATHNALTVNQITTASDEALQTATNNAVTILVKAKAGV